MNMARMESDTEVARHVIKVLHEEDQTECGNYRSVSLALSAEAARTCTEDAATAAPVLYRPYRRLTTPWTAPFFCGYSLASECRRRLQ